MVILADTNSQDAVWLFYHRSPDLLYFIMPGGDQFVSPLESDEGFSNFGVIYSQTVEVL